MPSIFDLYGEIGIEDGDLINDLKKIDSGLKSTAKEITNLENHAKSLGKTSASTARGFEKLREKSADVKSELAGAVKKFKDGDISAKQLEGSVRKAANAQKSLSSRTKDSAARLTDFADRAKKAEKAARGLSKISGHMRGVGDGIANVGRSLTAAITLPLAGIATLGIKSALSIDAAKTKLLGLLGTQAAVNKRWAELNKISDTSVGVLRSVAREQDVQLRAMKVGTPTIDKMIKSMGKLNAQFNIEDMATFTQNLNQIYQQDFERADIKEAIGRVPIFEDFIASMGGVDKMKAMKEAGTLTLDQFMTGMSDAIDNHPVLSNVQENLSTSLARSGEKLNEALAPIGDIILKYAVPAIQKLGEFVLMLSAYFAALPAPVQGVIVGVLGLVAALAPIAIVIGTLIVGVASIVGSAATLVAAVGGVIIAAKLAAIVGAAIVVAFAQVATILAAAAAGAYLLYKAYQTNFGGIKDFVDDAYQGIRSAVGKGLEKIQELTSKVLAQVYGFWLEHGTEIKQAATTVYKALESAVKAGLDFIRNLWKTHGDMIKAVASANWSVVSTLVLAGVKRVLDGIRLVAAIINGDWSKAWEIAKTIISDAWETAKTVVTQGGKAIGLALKALVGIVLDAKVGLLKAGAALGKNIVMGIVQGIRQNAPSIKSVISTLARTGLIGQFATMIQSNSPSKIFIGFGEDIVNGLMIGIKSKSKQVRETMQGLFNELVSVFKEIGIIREPTTLERFNKIISDPRLASSIKKYADALGYTVEQFKLINKWRLELADGFTNPIFDAKKPASTDDVGEGPRDRTTRSRYARSRVADLAEPVMPDLIMPPPPVAAWTNFFDTLKVRFDEMRSSLPSLKEAIGINLVDSISRVGDVFAGAVSNWDGTAKGFFKSIASGFKQMIHQIIAELVRLMVMKAILSLVGKFAGSALGGLGGLGGAATGAHEGAHIGGFAAGGSVSGRGSSTSDSVLSWLSDGEFVMKAKAVKKYGVGLMSAINSGTAKVGDVLAGLSGSLTPAYARGGLASPAATSGGSVSSTSVDSRNQSIYMPIEINNPNDAEDIRQSMPQIQADAEEMLAKIRYRRR